MKKLIRIFLMGIALLGTGSVFSQGFLGKTKNQIMAEIAKSVPKDNIVVSQSSGYDYYWFGFARSSIDNYTYFNSNGICFLQKYVISNRAISQMEIDRRSEDPEFHYYYAQFPWENNSHEFVQNKMSLELTITENKVFGGHDYHLWYFKPGDKRTVLQFFEKYYSKIIGNQYPLDRSVKDTTNESLNQFIINLKEVVVRRDIEKIKDFLDERMSLLFELCMDPLYPIDTSNEYYTKKLTNTKSSIWGKIEHALSKGGATEDKQIYLFPWYEAGFYNCEGVWNEDENVYEDWLADEHEVGAIIGENVNVRFAPSMNASVNGQLSWETIKVDREYDNEDWIKISTLDNRLSGYVYSQYVYSPTDLRIIISDTDAGWKIVSFRTWDM